MKNNILISLIGLFILSCYSTTELTTNTTPYSEPDPVFDFDLKSLLFVFPIEQNSNYGKAFIANHNIYTVKHLYETNENTDIGDTDVLILGETELKGLNICKEVHYKRTKAFTICQLGRIEIVLIDKGKNYYIALHKPAILPGDSGTPIFCYKHLSVIGLVSAYEPTRNFVWIGRIKNEQEVKKKKENE